MSDDLPPNLIVAVTDDDESVRESLGSLLEFSGYTVRLFDSAAALLASGALADIDCLISDIDMPRMDGYELARHASVARPELPVILVTGHHDLVNRRSRARSPQPKIFRKPFDVQELLTAVRLGLRRRLQKKDPVAATSEVELSRST